MSRICDKLDAVLKRITQAEQRYTRQPGSVRLLAVSKTKPAALIDEALACGQHAFGENYAQELAQKSDALAGRGIEWHFIGPIQSNKTRLIAAHAAWVHSIERLNIARRLSDQRDAGGPALQVCIQVNTSGEASKSGIKLAELPALAEAVAELPHLKLRGLMSIPAPTTGLEAQRGAFARLREAYEDLIRRGHALDTLSMGMSADMEAAIAEGATLVRIGRDIFGERN